ncbi:MAG TPA: FAD-dependent oxidoreductase [Gaiellales bacterium]|jgi:monoamine oxidase
MERRDVLVLGAGLAGLACARDLALGGADVLLLEARDRPGGRVEQATLADGRVAQMGGEIVGPVHHAYLELARELELPIVGSYTEEPGDMAYDLFDRVEIGEGWLDDGDHAALRRFEERLEAIARTVDPAHPWSHPDAARLDRRSVDDLLRETGATPAAVRVVLMHHLGAAAGPTHRWSVLASARAAAAAGGRSQFDYETWESLKIDGGSARLPLALAAELGDRLRLGAVVETVRVGAPCTVELENGERLEAEAVVCALPVGPLRNVHIEGLSQERLASLHRQRQVHASKAVTALADPAWRRVGWNGLAASERDIGGFWVQGESTLSSLFGPEQFAFVQAAPPGVATAMVRAALERILGEPMEPVAIEWRHWGADPFTLGYVSHWAPGDVLAVGPLHGTHEPPFYVAGSDHWACGYMEGAVATGRAAAAAALGAGARDLYPARAPV